MRKREEKKWKIVKLNEKQKQYFLIQSNPPWIFCVMHLIFLFFLYFFVVVRIRGMAKCTEGHKIHRITSLPFSYEVNTVMR